MQGLLKLKLFCNYEFILLRQHKYYAALFSLRMPQLTARNGIYETVVLNTDLKNLSRY